MQGPCFCKPGLMSQCIADNYSEEMSCRFFIISGCGARCMYRNEELDNHCWSQEAQSIGLYSEEEEGGYKIELNSLDGGDLALKDEKRNCLDCTHHPERGGNCLRLMQMSANAMHRGGLTYEDMETIAPKCRNYVVVHWKNS